MSNAVCWRARNTPPELRSVLRALGEVYPISEGGIGTGVQLSFEPGQTPGMCDVAREGDHAVIRYGGPAQAARGVGAVLAGLVPEGKGYHEATPFRTLGIMLDCSRNAVMTVEHVKVWLRRLSLLGYNMVMLYTEDTYELPNEPYFGYQRGAYTAAELRSIDAYARKLNIEIVPCIQTLGHLEKILRHGAYGQVRDTASVLLVGDDATYALIDKMIRQWRRVCSTDRIHIGMDETHDLGRGRYLDRHGYRHGFELFNEHLARVVDICARYDFKPIIWSDMYFRLGCESGGYYDPATVIPPAVAAAIPPAAQLVYWDYYHAETTFYLDWIGRHRALGREPLMGSGIWTWNRYWYDHRTTTRTAGPAIEACLEAAVQELFFTQWGDNGAYCDHDSAFAGMTFCADKAYGHTSPAEAWLESRFAAVCGGSYAAHLLAAELHGGVLNLQPNLWDDPIFETHFRTWAKNRSPRMRQAANGFAALAKRLQRHRDDRGAGDLQHAWTLTRTIALRYALAADLLAAYRRRDHAGLQAVKRQLPKVMAAVRAAEESFRTMWLAHNKPEGLETIQGRFGMLEARYRELDRRLAELLTGTRSRIPELDTKCPPA